MFLKIIVRLDLKNMDPILILNDKIKLTKLFLSQVDIFWCKFLCEYIFQDRSMIDMEIALQKIKL